MILVVCYAVLSSWLNGCTSASIITDTFTVVVNSSSQVHALADESGDHKMSEISQSVASDACMLCPTFSWVILPQQVSISSMT